MRRYAIAKYLHEDEKRRAVAGQYEPTSWRGYLRADAMFCPLGLALNAREGDPIPSVVADYLQGRGDPRDIMFAAAAFAWRWDAGRIPPDQLAVALGLEA